MTQRRSPNDAEDLSVRLARMQQLQTDLEQAIAEVERHSRELERIKRKVARLTEAIDRR